MPLITCLNGHEIELQTDQYGQRIACPICQLIVVVSPPRSGEPLLPKYEVLCENKHVLRVKSKYLGTQIRCPQCQGLAWVTTDRLQRNIPQTSQAEPIMPVVLAEPVIPRTAPAVIAKVFEIPVATSIDDIPVAELDTTSRSTKIPVARKADDDEEDDGADEQVLTKAERRSLKLADQGMGYVLGSIVGYCSIQIISIILSFIMFLIIQGVSTISGFETLHTFSEIVGWCIFISLVLNSLLYLGGIVLTLFMPWCTGATIWFILTVVLSFGLLGWLLFISIYANLWGSALPMLVNKDFLYVGNKLLYFIGETILIAMWLGFVLACWQLGKYARKPMTRQRVILLCMIGVACWLVMTLYPVLAHSITNSRTAQWVILIFRVLLTIGIGIVMIFQHLKVINDVRYVMDR